MKRDRTKDRHGEEWARLTGKVTVIDARTLEFADATRITLDYSAPEFDQMGSKGGELYPCGKEAADFLRTLIGDRPVTCVRNIDRERSSWIAHVGDTAIDQAMLINGWALADGRPQQAAELAARDAKRGLWAGKFIDPADWHAGVRLPGEPKPPPLSAELEAQQLIEAYGRKEPALSVVINRIVNDLPNARRLHLFGTGLRDEYLAQLCRLTELEELHIGSTSTTPAGLAHLKQLRRLKSLSVPDSSEAALAPIAGLTNLRRLSLTSNASDASLAHVAKLTELETLNLGWAPITDAGLSHLKGLRRLQMVRLGYSQISDNGLRHFKDLTELRRLDLYNTKITGAALAHLSGLKNLRQLDLHQTRVNDAGLAHLDGLDKLEYLNLSHDDITDAAVEHLIRLKGLKAIEVGDAISDRGKARLREAFPGLRFMNGSLGPP